MEPKKKRGRGRPPVTSGEDLQDAAFDLFSTYGYDETSAAMITTTAGTSRSTFFNYYRVKSDVFWLHLDRELVHFEKNLYREAEHADPLTVIDRAIAATIGDWDSAEVPWIYSNFELIGSPLAGYESAGPRIAVVHNAILGYLREYANEEISEQELLSICGTICGAIAGGVNVWALAGSDRGKLAPYVSQALQPLRAAFDL